MKLKLFSEKTGNMKPRLDSLEESVNEWLAEHPNIVIEHTHELAQPNAGWSHIGLAVWYSEK